MSAACLPAPILLSSSGLATLAHAQQDRYLDVHGAGEFKPIPIAVTAFSGDAVASAQLTAIITNNFKRSVFLAPIDPKTFVETISNPDRAPRMDS
jgi:TolB protein